MSAPNKPRAKTMKPHRMLPIYEILAQDLKDLGIDAVFGLVSDDTVLFATALDMIGVRFHGARHENSAIAMAEGYAATTGRLGIAIVGRGPATANGLHGAVYASRTGSPVLIIYGDAATGGNALNPLGPDYKELNAMVYCWRRGCKSFARQVLRGRARP